MLNVMKLIVKLNEQDVHVKKDSDNGQNEYFLELLNSEPIHNQIELQENVNDLAHQAINLAQSCHRTDVLKTVS